MKSRTSSFNPAVFKKDLTRFAPGWGAYLIVLLLVLTAMVNDNDAYYRIRDMRDAIVLVGWANLVYGCVVAQLLFGDLYNSRLCNALHAMPMTRDGWFVTHTAAGAVFSLLPNVIVALIAIPVLKLGVGTHTIFWWLVAAELQYVFFFGTAVLCVMATGNRLGQIALYLVIQFAGLLAGWLACSVYEPLLHGIIIDSDLFTTYCPVYRITEYDEMFVIDSTRLEDAFGNWMGFEIHSITLGEGWGYTALLAGLGLAALVAALVLYRKRKLECAGDLVAFPVLKPVALVLATVFVGGFFHLFGDLIGLNIGYVLLAVGAVVGYFACLMLLERTTRVFRKGAFLGCGVIVAAVALSLLITKLDPMCLTTWLPEANEVESITVSQSYSLGYHSDFPFEATEIEDVEALLEVHADGIDGSANDTTGIHPDSYQSFSLRLEYRMKDGKVVNRFYTVYPYSKAGQVLKGYFTRPECVLGFPAEEAADMVSYIRSMYANGRDVTELSELDLQGLLNAVVADCEAGNMAQISGFHYPTASVSELPEDEVYDDVITWVEIGWDQEKLDTHVSNRNISYTNFRVYRSCANTLKWLEANDLLSEDELKELGGVTAAYATG